MKKNQSGFNSGLNLLEGESGKEIPACTLRYEIRCVCVYTSIQCIISYSGFIWAMLMVISAPQSPP